MLTINEYEEISQRMECSFKLLDMLSDCKHDVDNFITLKKKVENEFDNMTVRAKVIKKQSEHPSAHVQNSVVRIFKLELVDISCNFNRAYLMLKHPKAKKYKLIDNTTYLLDRVKIVFNKKHEIVILSTSTTAIRQESDENFNLERLVLSQKELMIQDYYGGGVQRQEGER